MDEDRVKHLTRLNDLKTDSGRTTSVGYSDMQHIYITIFANINLKQIKNISFSRHLAAMLSIYISHCPEMALLTFCTSVQIQCRYGARFNL